MRLFPRLHARWRRLLLGALLAGVVIGFGWRGHEFGPQASTARSRDHAPKSAAPSAEPGVAVDAVRVAAVGVEAPVWAFCPAPAAAARWESTTVAPTREFHYLALNREGLTGKASAFSHPGGGVVSVPLPDGSVVEVVVERTQVNGPGRFVSEGRVFDRPGSRVVVAYVNGAVSASLEGVSAGEIKVRTLGEGADQVVQLYEVDTALSGVCGVAEHTVALDQAALTAAAVAATDANGGAGVAVGGDEALASGDGVVDLLVAYTSVVRSRLGSTASVLAEIDLAVAKVNSDFEASGITARVRLADAMEVELPGDEITTLLSTWQDTSLERLAGVTDGYMDDVHARRDAVGADLVNLVVARPDSNSSGLAYILSNLGHYSEPFYAFSVINYAGFSDATVLSHELGHNFGCAHARSEAFAASPSPSAGYHGAFPYSYGYRVTANDANGSVRTIRSIMAYSPGTRLRYFSSPLVSIGSYDNSGQTVTFLAPVTLGIADGEGVESADNVRTIESTTFQVSTYRLSPHRSVAGTLVNVSTRAVVGAGDKVLTGGFVITGTGTKRLLIRAPGPTIGAAPYFVAGALADPVLTVNHIVGGNASVVANNDDWGLPAANGIEVANLGGTVGAFSFLNGSADAALVTNLAPGAYTAAVTGKAGAEGYALIEVYEAGGDASARVVNLSTRGYATVAAPMIAGFVVKADNGDTTQRKTMFLRVRGPSLVNYGLAAAAVMADPTIEVYDGNGALIFKNDDWDSPSADLDGSSRDAIPLLHRGQIDQPSEQAVYDAAVAVGAGTDMLPVEPAAVVELPVGVYTVKVMPFENLPNQVEAPGLAIVEVYELSN